MLKSITVVAFYCVYLLQVSNYWCINASSSPPPSVFNDTNTTIDHLLTIMSSFSDVVMSTYKESMPDVAAVIRADVNELLDNIWSSTDNKRAVDATRVRYDDFIRESQKSIDAAIKIIRTSFDEVQTTLGDASVKLFETATTLENGLREKGCDNEEILAFFNPYVNGTVDCVQKALTVEDHYRSNAETAGEAVQTVLKSVVTSLKLCTNKGSRVVFCAQRNSLSLNARTNEIKRLTERQFTRVEKQNLQKSFQDGRVCIRKVLDDGEKTLKSFKCDEKIEKPEEPEVTTEESTDPAIEEQTSNEIEETLSENLKILRKMIDISTAEKDNSEPVLDEELMEYFDD